MRKSQHTESHISFEKHGRSIGQQAPPHNKPTIKARAPVGATSLQPPIIQTNK